MKDKKQGDESKIKIALEYGNNIIATLREPFLVLDKNLRIISTNQAFYTSFKVTEKDSIGRLLPDLGDGQWNIPKLIQLLKEIIPGKKVVKDYEVEHKFEQIGERTMVLNACQVRVPKKIAGIIAAGVREGGEEEELVLLSIEDITERKEIEAGLEKTRKELAVIKIAADEVREFAESIINTVREPLIVLDQDLRVIEVSSSFYEFFKVKPEETVGQFIYDLGNKQWDIPKLRELLETILPQKATFDNYEVEHDFATIGRRTMLLNARQIQRVLGKERVILLAIEDITERKQMEHQVRERMKELQAFYGLAEITEREGITLDKLYQELANILPKSWQYPEIACARIVIGDSEFPTKNFTESKWMQSAQVKVNKRVVGKIEVGYLEERPEQDEGPFLKEERRLIDAIAERLGHITERKRAEEMLIKRTAELEVSNKELESFAYSVSHDLRAPLRTIDGFSHALLEDYDDKLDVQGKDYLRRVRAATQMMAQLIDDMLKISRITRTEMNTEKVNLTQIARSVINELQKSQPERLINIKIADGLEEIADSKLMRIALENLLGNAWKFTGKQAEAVIEFGATKEGERKVYFIRDNGAGFDMAYVDKLFAPFQRLHTMEEYPGTGIGLATVRRIINRHGGRVWAEGQVDKGATFYFSLQG